MVNKKIVFSFVIYSMAAVLVKILFNYIFSPKIFSFFDIIFCLLLAILGSKYVIFSKKGRISRPEPTE